MDKWISGVIGGAMHLGDASSSSSIIIVIDADNNAGGIGGGGGETPLRCLTPPMALPITADNDAFLLDIQ